MPMFLSWYRLIELLPPIFPNYTAVVQHFASLQFYYRILDLYHIDIVTLHKKRTSVESPFGIKVIFGG